MDTKNRPQSGNENQQASKPEHERVSNPFEDHKSADENVADAKEELDKEQQYKEGLTERD